MGLINGQREGTGKGSDGGKTTQRKTQPHGVVNMRKARAGMRWCTRCWVEKSLSQFDENPGSRDGYRHLCRGCTDLSPEWRVYVIELSDGVGSRRHWAYQNVYVEQTGNHIDYRYWQHMNDPRTGSKKVRDYGSEFLYSLFPKDSPVGTQEEAYRQVSPHCALLSVRVSSRSASASRSASNRWP
jgi:hypothetical protein